MTWRVTGCFLALLTLLSDSPLSAEQGTFHLNQANRPRTRSALGYGVDGSYTARKDGVGVVKIEHLVVVAHALVTLHSFKIGLCSETDGFVVPGDEVFAPEIPLNEKSLETNQQYDMPGRTVRIVLTKKVPHHNYFCGVLSNSVGNDFAEDLRMPTVVRASQWTK